jgi:peptidoglycan/LPS O-acetylase OafA/YrhL
MITSSNVGSLPMLGWFAGQLTLLMAYTPAALRPYGLGNPNGALWTIPIEIEFYCVVPVLVYVASRSRKQGNPLILVLCLVSIASNAVIAHLDTHLISTKFMMQTVAPFLFFFLFGTAAYVNWDLIRSWIHGRFAIWLVAFAAYSFVLSGVLGLYEPSYWPNAFGIGAAFFLSCLTLSLAFTRPSISKKLLRGNDCSYGLYLLHGVVLNLLVQHHIQGSGSRVLGA